MPQTYEFDLLHADGIRHTDLDAGVRVLNELIFECQQSHEGIEHAKLDLEARGRASGHGLREGVGEMIACFGFLRPSLPPLSRPPTEARSCRPMTTATSFKRRPTSCG